MLKRTIAGLIFAGLVAGAQTAAATINVSPFPPSGDDIQSHNMNYARDSEPAKMITGIPAVADNPVFEGGTEHRTGLRANGDAFPASYGD